MIIIRDFDFICLKKLKVEIKTQVFICWVRESEFDEALYITSKLNLRYPQIELYVRFSDDELVDLVQRYNAKTFSSSLNAFKLLQKKYPLIRGLPQRKMRI